MPKRGYKMSEMSKMKMREAHRRFFAAGGKSSMTNRHHSKETKAILREKRLGQPSPWLGKHHSQETKDLFRAQRVGKRNPGSVATQFKLGLTPWNKGTAKLTYNRPVSNYGPLHGWLVYNFGPASRCQNYHCLKKSKFFQWAHIHKKPYEKNQGFFVQLCAQCHWWYDRKNQPIYYEIYET